MLSGLDLPAFHEDLKAIRNINAAFEAEFPPGKFQPLEVVNVHGQDCIRISNRFLTPKSDTGSSQHIADSMKLIDPYGILQRAAGPKYVHTEDNVVKYYKKRQFKVGEDM